MSSLSCGKSIVCVCGRATSRVKGVHSQVGDYNRGELEATGVVSSELGCWQVHPWRVNGIVKTHTCILRCQSFPLSFISSLSLPCTFIKFANYGVLRR